jgi:hypothetical protein
MHRSVPRTTRRRLEGQPSLLIAAVVMMSACAFAVTLAGHETYGPPSAAPALLTKPDETTPASEAASDSLQPDAQPFAWPDAVTRTRSVALAHAILLHPSPQPLRRQPGESTAR